MNTGHKGDVVGAALFNRRYDKLSPTQLARVHDFIIEYTAAAKLPAPAPEESEPAGGASAAGFEGHAPTVKVGPAK